MVTRILEKRNLLQMSQVFPFPYIGDQMGLAFQGFYKRDRRTGKVIGLPPQLYMHAQIKKPSATRRARGSARTFNPYKFRSAVSEAASPKRCCSHAVLLSLHLAVLRRGLAGRISIPRTASDKTGVSAK